jgi:hypothetical protein
MEEDLKICEIQKNVIKVMKDNFKIHPQQNGVLISLEGEPLVAEFFSNPLVIPSTVKKTLIASSFDSTTWKNAGIEKHTVERFLDEVLATKIHTVRDEDWGVYLSGGTESLDTQLSKESEERLMHFSTINRGHPALIGV